MPAAVAIPAIISAAGAAAQAHAGKKAGSAANAAAQQQLAIQQQAFGLAKQQLTPAASFWQSLLKGGQAAVQATGPTASQIGQGAEGGRTAIQAITPRGGEQNLALAQNYNTASNNIARLYAGMQPLAAQGLTQIGGAFLGGAQPSPGAGLAGYLSQQQMANQGAAGFGSMLYNTLNKPGGSGGGSTVGKGTTGGWAPGSGGAGA